ncbi:hypothetical protein C8A05DRAFT_11668 [Staphylotrichum tortipilum]|uniref:Uncharacterized protein n=1 Tax=Staphylotrichum tortipilum TaxID=2831512 RepID=A0AAN6MVU8_9PEZI|nr:hypothetical protein C8A05DRAFT_11668 [Staphylotrichum longicolle]
MLLTSGQVSVAVTAGIVFLCTTALFLSGYVIQQRTLRDLRAAIKPSPRPSPRILLPDRFKQSTTELADGTIIVLNDGGDPSEQGAQKTVEVKPTVAEGTSKQAQRPISKQSGKTGRKRGTSSRQSGKGKVAAGDGADQPQKQMSRAERRRRIKEEIMKLSQGEERGYYQRRLW